MSTEKKLFTLGFSVGLLLGIGVGGFIGFGIFSNRGLNLLSENSPIELNVTTTKAPHFECPPLQCPTVTCPPCPKTEPEEKFIRLPCEPQIQYVKMPCPTPMSTTTTIPTTTTTSTTTTIPTTTTTTTTTGTTVDTIASSTNIPIVHGEKTTVTDEEYFNKSDDEYDNFVDEYVDGEDQRFKRSAYSDFSEGDWYFMNETFEFFTKDEILARVEDVAVRMSEGEVMTDARRTMIVHGLKKAFSWGAARTDSFELNNLNNTRFFLSHQFKNNIYNSAVAEITETFGVNEPFFTDISFTPPRFFTRDKLYMKHLLAAYKYVKELDAKYKRAEIELINKNKMATDLMTLYYTNKTSTFKELLHELRLNLLQPAVETLYAPEQDPTFNLLPMNHRVYQTTPSGL